MHSIPYLLEQRRIGRHCSSYNQLLVSRLGPLHGSEALGTCCTSLAFCADDDGRPKLAVGDETSRLQLWRPDFAGGTLAHAFDTGHTGTILCVRFLNGSGGSKIVCCSTDRQVRLVDLQRQATRPFVCHRARVKALASVNPDVFLSASEDGTVRLYDVRLVGGGRAAAAGPDPHSLMVEQRCERAGRSSLRISINSLAVSPLAPHLFATGGGDPFARLYDLRMLRGGGAGAVQGANTGGTGAATAAGAGTSGRPAWVSCFAPHAMCSPGVVGGSSGGFSTLGRVRHITGVAFAAGGQHLLLSYSGDAIYAMDVRQHGMSYEQLDGRLRQQLAASAPASAGGGGVGGGSPAASGTPPRRATPAAWEFYTPSPRRREWWEAGELRAAAARPADAPAADAAPAAAGSERDGNPPHLSSGSSSFEEGNAAAAGRAGEAQSHSALGGGGGGVPGGLGLGGGLQPEGGPAPVGSDSAAQQQRVLVAPPPPPGLTLQPLRLRRGPTRARQHAPLPPLPAVPAAAAWLPPPPPLEPPPQVSGREAEGVLPERTLLSYELPGGTMTIATGSSGSSGRAESAAGAPPQHQHQQLGADPAAEAEAGIVAADPQTTPAPQRPPRQQRLAWYRYSLSPAGARPPRLTASAPSPAAEAAEGSTGGAAAAGWEGMAAWGRARAPAAATAPGGDFPSRTLPEPWPRDEGAAAGSARHCRGTADEQRPRRSGFVGQRRGELHAGASPANVRMADVVASPGADPPPSMTAAQAAAELAADAIRGPHDTATAVPTLPLPSPLEALPLLQSFLRRARAQMRDPQGPASAEQQHERQLPAETRGGPSLPPPSSAWQAGTGAYGSGWERHPSEQKRPGRQPARQAPRRPSASLNLPQAVPECHQRGGDEAAADPRVADGGGDGAADAPCAGADEGAMRQQRQLGGSQRGRRRRRGSPAGVRKGLAGGDGDGGDAGDGAGGWGPAGEAANLRTAGGAGERSEGAAATVRRRTRRRPQHSGGSDSGSDCGGVASDRAAAEAAEAGKADGARSSLGMERPRATAQGARAGLRQPLKRRCRRSGPGGAADSSCGAALDVEMGNGEGGADRQGSDAAEVVNGAAAAPQRDSGSGGGVRFAAAAAAASAATDNGADAPTEAAARSQLPTFRSAVEPLAAPLASLSYLNDDDDDDDRMLPPMAALHRSTDPTSGAGDEAAALVSEGDMLQAARADQPHPHLRRVAASADAARAGGAAVSGAQAPVAEPWVGAQRRLAPATPPTPSRSALWLRPPLDERPGSGGREGLMDSPLPASSPAAARAGAGGGDDGGTVRRRLGVVLKPGREVEADGAAGGGGGDEGSGGDGDGGYLRCFDGHKNVMTIKEVAWLGGSGGGKSYVMSGSDEGYVVIWDYDTAEIVRMLPVHEHVIPTCLTVQPGEPMLATCGNGSLVRLWGPGGSDPRVGGGASVESSDSEMEAGGAAGGLAVAAASVARERRRGSGRGEGEGELLGESRLRALVTANRADLRRRRQAEAEAEADVAGRGGRPVGAGWATFAAAIRERTADVTPPTGLLAAAAAAAARTDRRSARIVAAPATAPPRRGGGAVAGIAHTPPELDDSAHRDQRGLGRPPEGLLQPPQPAAQMPTTHGSPGQVLRLSTALERQRRRSGSPEETIPAFGLTPPRGGDGGFGSGDDMRRRGLGEALVGDEGDGGDGSEGGAVDHGVSGDGVAAGDQGGRDLALGHPVCEIM